jgi:hypothetical protein
MGATEISGDTFFGKLSQSQLNKGFGILFVAFFSGIGIGA